MINSIWMRQSKTHATEVTGSFIGAGFVIGNPIQKTTVMDDNGAYDVWFSL
jgi:hypothetical protein